MEVWTLSFVTGNADNEFCSFAQKAVVVLVDMDEVMITARENDVID